MYYTYILESLTSGDYYKGSTSNYLKRLEQHNNGESEFTRHNRPWKLIFVQIMETKSEALILEKKLKRCNKLYLQWLINQDVNILNKTGF